MYLADSLVGFEFSGKSFGCNLKMNVTDWLVGSDIQYTRDRHPMPQGCSYSSMRILRWDIEAVKAYAT